MADQALEDQYLPNILPYFDEHGDVCPDVNIQVTCSICSVSKLAILQPPSAPNRPSRRSRNRNQGNNEDEEEYESWTVLPCGHMFGYKCIQEWIRTIKGDGGLDNYGYEIITKCPLCNEPLDHSGCRHTAKISEFRPRDGFNIHFEMPDLLGEGRQLPPFCDDCRRNEYNNNRNRNSGGGHGLSGRDRGGSGTRNVVDEGTFTFPDPDRPGRPRAQSAYQIDEFGNPVPRHPNRPDNLYPPPGPILQWFPPEAEPNFHRRQQQHQRPDRPNRCPMCEAEHRSMMTHDHGGADNEWDDEATEDLTSNMTDLYLRDEPSSSVRRPPHIPQDYTDEYGHHIREFINENGDFIQEYTDENGDTREIISED